MVIKRHGREIAKLGPMDIEPQGLPALTSFRACIKCKGKTLGQDIVDSREQERY